MTNVLPIPSYPGLIYQPSEIIKFKESIDFFSLLLVTNEVIHFTPDQPEAFRIWLSKNGIEALKN